MGDIVGFCVLYLNLATISNYATRRNNQWLKSFTLSSCLSEEEIIYMIKSGDLRIIEKHHKVFESGQLSDEIFFLLKGVVKITTSNNDNREVIKMILHPKAILGEHSLAGEEVRNNNATVMTPDATVLQ
jgi:CRP-like cAMP-binding protein